MSAVLISGAGAGAALIMGAVAGAIMGAAAGELASRSRAPAHHHND